MVIILERNNTVSTVEGSESILVFNTDQIEQKINNLEKNNLYDFNYDKIFLDISLNFIIEAKLLFIERYIKKFLTLLYSISIRIIQITTIQSYCIMVFLSIFFIIILIYNFKKKKSFYLNYFLLNFILTVGIFSIFFILPRYKLIVLPLQLILINFWLQKYFKKGV